MARTSKSPPSLIQSPAMARIRLPNNWQPRLCQFALWDHLQNGGRRAVEVAHRRWGNDDDVLHWTALAAHQRLGNYWHLLPQKEQARKALWTAVNPHSGQRRIDEAFPPAIRENTNDNEMFIRFKNGSTWQVLGSDNYAAMVGTPPVGIVFSEWARADPAAWAYLAPILLENGGWAVFITTPLGSNHAKDTLDLARKSPGWFSEVQTIDDSKAISREAVEEQRLEYHSIYGEDAGDGLIEQEFWCSFSAAVLGSYYGKLIAQAEKEG